MQRGSLRTRIVLTNTAIVAALLVGGGYLMQTASRNASLQLLDRGLMGRAVEISTGPFPGLEAPFGPNALERPEGGEPPQPPGQFQPVNGPGVRPRLGSPEGQAGPGPAQPFGRVRGQGLGQGLGPGRGNGGGRGPRGIDFGRPVWLDASGKVAAPPGRTLPWSGDLAQKSLKGASLIETVSSLEGPLRIASVPVRRQGRIIGAVQVVQPLEGLQVAMAAGRQVFLWVVPIGLLASGLVGWLALRSSLAPVERATQTAQRIAETGALGERLPVAGADEMSRLSEAFNQMLEKLAVTQADKDKALKQLSEALEDQKRFTADASHELRTPLASLRLSISGLRNGQELAPDVSRQLELMDGVSKGMARLVDDLLTLARADSGSLALNKEPLDLRKPLAEALLVSGLADDERVVTAFPEGPLGALGDEDAVRRIAVNLLANAKRHCPEGQIFLGGSSEAPWTLFWVEDHGEGMKAEDAAQAGTRFFRADSSRARDKGGHGLGLAICRSLAEAMGGGLSIVSEEGKGSRVQVWLPSSHA